MNIFIDEAGVFVIPSKKKCSISGVGGLAIPEKATEKVFFDFLKLKESWGVGAVEIKGSRLSESQVQSVIRLLRQYDVIFDIIAIDMNKQHDKAIFKHKLRNPFLLDSESGFNWTVNPETTGHPIRF